MYAGLSAGGTVGVAVGSVVLLGVLLIALIILLMYGFKQYHQHNQKFKIATHSVYYTNQNIVELGSCKSD